MVGITYISTDPAFAAAVANRSMELYLATLRDRNLADRNDALRSLSKRIPLVRAEVVRADAALQSYRIKHGFTEESRTDMVDQQLVDLNRQLAVARSDLAERHARPTTLSIGQTTNQSQSTEESSTLETRARQLERRIAILQDASTEMREPEAQLRELQREATAFVQLYDSLVQRRKGNSRGSKRSAGCARIIVCVYPDSPELAQSAPIYSTRYGARLYRRRSAGGPARATRRDVAHRARRDRCPWHLLHRRHSAAHPQQEAGVPALNVKMLSLAGWTAIRRGFQKALQTGRFPVPTARIARRNASAPRRIS